MRRKEKEIIEKSEMEAVIAKASVCRLAMAEENTPYVVPLCFGFEDNALDRHPSRFLTLDAAN